MYIVQCRIDQVASDLSSWKMEKLPNNNNGGEMNYYMKFCTLSVDLNI